MARQIMSFAVIAAVLAGASLLPAAALAVGITLDELSWQTIGAAAGEPYVRFEARFVNPNNEGMSDPVTGELNPQPFGAFVGNADGFICGFEVPPIPPGKSYTVTCEIPLSDLPPSAERLLPWEGEAAGPQHQEPIASGNCPEDNFWAGGVEASWGTGDGGGVEAVHRGSLLVCPSYGCSYIRVIAECPDGAPWAFQNECSGFDPGLVDSDFEGASNPLPPGRFEGWMCVDPDPKLYPGQTCSFDCVFECGRETARLQMEVLVCDCARTTAIEPSTWGAIKQRLSR